jgi:hypothetical protein
MARIGGALSAELQAAEGRPIAARVTLRGPTGLHGTLLAGIERVRQGVVAEARQHGADRVWIEQVLLDTTPTADLDSLRGRPDAIGRLAKILDELVGELGGDLLGEYPHRLRTRMPDVELPAEHPLRDGGPGSQALLKVARELVLARLAQEV